MRNLRNKILVTVVVCVLAGIACEAQSGLRVSEAATKIKLLADGSLVELTVENPSRGTISARVLLELLDPNGKVKVHSEQESTFSPGVTKWKGTLPSAFATNTKPDRRDLLWDRLRYTITPGTPAGSSPVSTMGILSLGETMPEIFELHVAGPAFVKAGGHYTMRVRAIHPVTSRPVAGVSVQAALDVDASDDKPLLTKTVATDRKGFATLEFTVPTSIDDDDVDVKVTGKLAGYSTEADGEFHLNYIPNISLSTDKPIYQPGQALHMRLLGFDFNKKAIADQKVTLKILDPEDTLVYRTEMQTSRFGVAAADWQIPDNLRLGTYKIEAQFGDSQLEETGAGTTVKISRYELPTFSVTAKPDRTYYLPDQNASLEIRADYLFGEPVRKGHVRVARESERTWNYKEQKWEIEEGKTYEGDTDGQGHYTAKIDLTEEHRQLGGNDYERFRDLKFAAYYTDASTGRTEQRRFDLRITKDPVHVYVIGTGGSVGNGMPLDFYISTSRADGTPTQCEVEINWAADYPKGRNHPETETAPQFLRKVQTNRYGLAKVSNLTVPNPDDLNDFLLSFQARDRKGEVGHHTESLWRSDRPEIQVKTDKTLYKAGEPIEVQLTTSQRDLTVVVDAVHELQVQSSRLVRVRNGHASLVFEGNDKFENEVTILAYAFGIKPGGDYYHAPVAGAHTVLFPKDRELKVDVKLAKPVYRPEEQATADLRVTGADGNSAKSAVGLVVVDKAVEERQRTDGEFGTGGGFYSYRNIWSESTELSGVQRSDLNKIDLTKPVPDGLELVAEILLQGNSVWPETFESETDTEDLHKLFAAEIDPKIQPIKEALDKRYEKNGEYPKTEAALESVLADAGIHFGEIKDPWGTPYRAGFRSDREWDVLTISSAGPDRIFGTDDDFFVATLRWEYFKDNREAIWKAVQEYHERTHEYIRDAEILRSELGRIGIDLDSWKDHWGHAYQITFGVSRTQYTITVTSAGPDGRFSTKTIPSDDDFTLATVGIDYFAETLARMDAALAANFRATQNFPGNIEELRKALERTGMNWDGLRDPWGHPYMAAFRQESRYSDDLRVISYEQYLQKGKEKTTAVPVTQKINWVYVRSMGEDGVEGTSDDFDVAAFSRGVVEQSAKDNAPVAMRDRTVLEGSRGAIQGTVTDPTGAVIPNAEINAKNAETGEIFTAKTNENGEYVARNLPAGFYTVQITSPGFSAYAITRVPVRSSNVTRVDGTLNVGTVSEMVTVEAARIDLQTQSVSALVALKPGVTSVSLPKQAETPRLREYFPETLLWKPEIVTDEKGRTRIKIPLADNITTWKLAAVASTVNGEIGSAEKEIRAFQPFFVEHDPPRFLTVGDEIALPVVLRNYLDRRLAVNVAMKPSAWFTALSPVTLKTEVPAQASARDIFRFKAVNAVNEGKQEISAIGAEASDAISRGVTVRPNGEEKTESVSQVFGETASLDVTVPENAISGSVDSRLKIYPNLTTHVLESIEAILRRPYGCGEQTISSTYPSVLLLKYAKHTGDENSPVVNRARRYTRMGYERLLSYRVAGGGFSYWGRGNADLALTMYAIKFLRDASEFTAVDDSIIEEAEGWVLNQAKPEGYWEARDWYGKEKPQRSAMLTAYVARMLVASRRSAGSAGGNPQIEKTASSAVQHALAYLQPKVEEMDEPYVIASYALAALGAEDKQAFAKSVTRLRSLERREGESSYWTLEMNTPFYGWGLAGRVETTALVLQVLAKDSSSEELDALVSRGLLFLLRNQDSYGIWYSTQATINVLDAIGSLTSGKNIRANQTGEDANSVSKAAIFVDGKQVTAVALPPANALRGPIDVDLSKFVVAGKHHIEIHRAAGASRASTQVVTDYYVPWTHSGAESSLLQEEKKSDSLRLVVHYNKQSVNSGESIQCQVSAERIGFRGYGMMLAEIGLPPGAEVDRGSLETAMMASGWDINQYDILPDRVIVYLWPHAGGTKFSFTFKPRYGLKALSTASSLYDYYNPEAHATVEPVEFTVQ